MRVDTNTPREQGEGGDTPQLADRRSTSDDGIRFIAREEAFRARQYLDEAGYPTLGYGPRLRPAESYPNGITEEDARRLLSDDIGVAERAIQDSGKAHT